MTHPAKSPDERHFMDHPEVDTYMRNLFPAITAESDRGAILLGAAQIDEQLKAFFLALLPTKTNRERKDEIFGFNGPFGTLSAKLDVAYTCRLLPPSLIEAVHLFRKLRNDLAHKTEPFSLNHHSLRIRKIFSLVGPGVDVGVSSTTVDMLLENGIGLLSQLDHPTRPGEPMFQSRSDILAYLTDNKHHLRKLDDHRMKWEIGVGVGLICGLLIHLRNDLVKIVAEHETFSASWRASNVTSPPDA